VIRNRKLTESEVAGSFDPRRKGSDRTGPELLLPANTAGRARRDDPARRFPFAVGTRKEPQTFRSWRIRAWQSVGNLLMIRRDDNGVAGLQSEGNLRDKRSDP
jgi:hypothetical protein